MYIDGPRTHILGGFCILILTMESDAVMRNTSYPKLTMRQAPTGSIRRAVVNIVLNSKNLVKSRWDGEPSGLILRFIPDPRFMRQLFDQLRENPYGVLVNGASNLILEAKKQKSEILRSKAMKHYSNNGLMTILQSNRAFWHNSNKLSIITRRAAPKLRSYMGGEISKIANNWTICVKQRSNERKATPTWCVCVIENAKRLRASTWLKAPIYRVFKDCMHAE